LRDLLLPSILTLNTSAYFVLLMSTPTMFGVSGKLVGFKPRVLEGFRRKNM
jgi:hypothetical protein